MAITQQAAEEWITKACAVIVANVVEVHADRALSIVRPAAGFVVAVIEVRDALARTARLGLLAEAKSVNNYRD
jgi:hypothetical protein